MAITVSRRLARRSITRATSEPAEPAGPAGPAGTWARAVRPADETATTPLAAAMGGFPHAVDLQVLPASRRDPMRQVDVEADPDAVLADWWERGRVELMVRGRPFVLETDLDGRGIRLVEPMGREPVAAFEPGRHGGRVRLADGAVLRWLEPSRAEFASGFVGHGDVNIIRFALDGTALVLVDPDAIGPGAPRPARARGAGSGHTRRGDVADPRLGWVPDVVALLVLGWFLRLVGPGSGVVDRWAEAAVPVGPAGSAASAGRARRVDGAGSASWGAAAHPAGGVTDGRRLGPRPVARRLPALVIDRSGVR